MLPSGKTLPCEVVIAGVGVVPATDFLKESGLPMSGRGEVVVNGNMCAEGDVYAAGDIARFPLPLIGDSTSIGHWQLAHNHGKEICFLGSTFLHLLSPPRRSCGSS